jgi:hypothetical protein
LHFLQNARSEPPPEAQAKPKLEAVGSSAWFGKVSRQASVQLFTHLLRR